MQDANIGATIFMSAYDGSWQGWQEHGHKAPGLQVVSAILFYYDV